MTYHFETYFIHLTMYHENIFYVIKYSFTLFFKYFIMKSFKNKWKWREQYNELKFNMVRFDSSISSPILPFLEYFKANPSHHPSSIGICFHQ